METMGVRHRWFSVRTAAPRIYTRGVSPDHCTMALSRHRDRGTTGQKYIVEGSMSVPRHNAARPSAANSVAQLPVAHGSVPYAPPCAAEQEQERSSRSVARCTTKRLTAAAATAPPRSQPRPEAVTGHVEAPPPVPPCASRRATTRLLPRGLAALQKRRRGSRAAPLHPRIVAPSTADTFSGGGRSRTGSPARAALRERSRHRAPLTDRRLAAEASPRESRCPAAPRIVAPSTAATFSGGDRSRTGSPARAALREQSRYRAPLADRRLAALQQRRRGVARPPLPANHADSH
jgi:hypothetical protein